VLYIHSTAKWAWLFTCFIISYELDVELKLFSLMNNYDKERVVGRGAYGRVVYVS